MYRAKNIPQFQSIILEFCVKNKRNYKKIITNYITNYDTESLVLIIFIHSLISNIKLYLFINEIKNLFKFIFS